MLGGRLHGVRHPDDRMAEPRPARGRPRTTAAGTPGVDRRRALPGRLLDRRRAPAHPGPLARARAPGGRVLRSGQRDVRPLELTATAFGGTPGPPSWSTGPATAT